MRLFFLALAFMACSEPATTLLPKPNRIQSPDQQFSLAFRLTDAGAPQYFLMHQEDTLLAPSSLGFELQDAPALKDGFRIVDVQTRSEDSQWETLWGEDRLIRNQYNELRITLEESQPPKRQLGLSFRLYNDGLGFRYHFPESLGEFAITDELTTFQLKEDAKAWWIPANYDSYEMLYRQSQLSAIPTDEGVKRQISKNKQANNPMAIPNQDKYQPGAVNTPITLQLDSLYLSLHEAALVDYPGMTLGIQENNLLKAALVPWPNGIKAYVKAPFSTPWRTIQFSRTPAGLVESKLILNLNEDNKLDNTDWIEPMKYIGIWWGMHINKDTWAAGSKHGATTENTKAYIDFAADHSIRGVLVEGWNEGWERWGQQGAFRFTQPYPDFDIRELTDYAKSKGVALIGHHETGGDMEDYEHQLNDAFSYYYNLGIKAVKTGYAGNIRPEGQTHHGQYAVRHYLKVVETAAKYQVMLDAHEPIKPTGLRRTWPNMMTREGVRGQEYNAWSEGNPPSHTVTLPFTRMLAGPVDYTPGIFNIKFDEYKKDNSVKTTLSHQLALMVILYSPLQMAADLPEHYDQMPDAFRFIEEVGVDWEQSRVLHGEIGEYVTIARQKRGTEEWFIGSATNEEARKLQIPLDFLPEGKMYKLRLYADAADAHWNDNPTAYTIKEFKVTSETRLNEQLAPGGGLAISLFPISDTEAINLKEYPGN